MSLDGPPYIPATPCTVWGVVEDFRALTQKVASSPEMTQGVRPIASHDPPSCMRIRDSMHCLYASVELGRPHTRTDCEIASRQSEYIEEHRLSLGRPFFFSAFLRSTPPRQNATRRERKRE